MGVYISHLKKYFGNDVAIRDFGYLSSEARASIPMRDSGCGGVLAIMSNFYEFIPREEMAKGEKRFLLSHQLETGKEYYVILTTPGGLYRYNIDFPLLSAASVAILFRKLDKRLWPLS